MKFLFIVKDRNASNPQKQIASLIHAAENNAIYLRSLGHIVNVAGLPDANYIDSALKQHKPDITISEAVWINPEKFKTLLPRNQYIKNFIIRIHSDFAYFAIESLGFPWIFESAKVDPKIRLASNCKNVANNMGVVSDSEFLYLPNIYDVPLSKSRKDATDVVNIGLFGAIRLLKNHLVQAIAAIKFCELNNKKLHFYINELTSDAGGSILNNIKHVFNHNPKHKLFVEKYRQGEEYNNFIKYMDLGMQVSFSESFNLVAANFVCNGVPIVVGDCVNWMPIEAISSYTDIDDMVAKIKFAYMNRNNHAYQLKQMAYLKEYNISAKNAWNEFLNMLSFY